MPCKLEDEACWSEYVVLQRGGPFQAGYGRIWEAQSVTCFPGGPDVPRHGLSVWCGARGLVVGGSSPEERGAEEECWKLTKFDDNDANAQTESLPFFHSSSHRILTSQKRAWPQKKFWPGKPQTTAFSA